MTSWTSWTSRTSYQDTCCQGEGEEGGGVTGRKGVPEVHAHAINEGQLDIGTVGSKPSDRSRGVNDMLDELGRERRKDHRRGSKDTVPYPAKEQKEDTNDIGEPFCDGGIIPIKYIARGRVTVAKEEMQVGFRDIDKD